ncbi:MAG TPA: exodeoxyribonuclease III [Candidatus Limnocylindrales bacterium]|nr:exodeoxyribonuclease III [Candidatus Limnocylindrales bacterium]
MTRIITWNVNGIRAVIKKGFCDFLERERPDILCLQEVKCTPEQMPVAELERFGSLGYTVHWNPARKAGYSGVATFCRAEPLFVTPGTDFERGEGRVLITEHGDFTLYNCYFPNGRQTAAGPDPQRLAFKLEFYERVLEQIEEERAEGKNVIVTGDWNTALEEIDLARPKENQGQTGFLPEERNALRRFVDRGWVDVFRHFHPAHLYEGRRPEERDYTWWSYWPGARERNLGWRIDHYFVNEEMIPLLRDAAIWDDVQGSDHCPVVADLKI